MTPSARICISIVILNEGGLVDNPADPGGLTNYGISWRAHPELSRDDIEHLTLAHAASIYAADYWGPLNAGELPLPLALCALDGAVMSGTGNGAKWVQRAIGTTTDGDIGPETIAAAKACKDVPMAVRQACMYRLGFLQRLDTYPTFGAGWSARVESVRGMALELCNGH